MCGIYGGEKDMLAQGVADVLHHRGPSQRGEANLNTRAGRSLVLGQTRLAVVVRGDVPTPLARGDSVIVFNGEIYDWRAIRAELEAHGHTFSTETDTEVVLAAFIAWGPACLDRFNGMFAFAIWHEGKLFLARDRLGKKPLYYTRSARGLAFASELKAFAQLDYVEVPICRDLEFYFDEHTPFRNVYSLAPGEHAEFDPDAGTLEKRTWWRMPEPEVSIVDPKEGVTRLLDVFVDACKIRKLADVPVTLFLSGGIDSTLIQAVLGLPVTYTVQFEEFRQTINEEDLVREHAAKAGFDARFVRPTRETFDETFSAFARAIEVPVGSFSVFPLYCLSRAAAEDGFVVALSGEGADELFNGYFRNELLLREDAAIAPDLAGAYETLARRYHGSGLERFARMASRTGIAGLPGLVDYLAPRWRATRTFAQNISRIETTIFLQPLLVMADRLSMAHSLEVRNPFLDHRVVELSTRVSDDLKFRDGRGKWILREALASFVGRDLGVLARKEKHGLPSPVNRWLLKSDTFDRKDWNPILLGECLRQLVQRRAGRS